MKARAAARRVFWAWAASLTMLRRESEYSGSLERFLSSASAVSNGEEGQRFFFFFLESNYLRFHQNKTNLPFRWFCASRVASSNCASCANSAMLGEGIGSSKDSLVTGIVGWIGQRQKKSTNKTPGDAIAVARSQFTYWWGRISVPGLQGCLGPSPKIGCSDPTSDRGLRVLAGFHCAAALAGLEKSGVDGSLTPPALCSSMRGSLP